MKRSELFITSSKESEASSCRSEELAIKSGLIHNYGSGTFGYTAFGKKVLDNIESVVRDEMDEVAQEVRMNLLQTSELWKQSGRWKNFEGEEFFHFKNRDNRDFCLAATHEEASVGLVEKYIRSYNDLDLTIYQIGRKFRDDHARKGLLRAKEFTMKDAYSFHKDEKGLDQKFDDMIETYRKIFDRLGLEYSIVGADSGSMGGDHSREFIAESDEGSDTYMKCRNCDFGSKDLELERCIECESNMKEVDGIEIGHCFKLGTRYSDAMDLTFQTEEDLEKSVLMGCYGIGVSRVISAIIEQNNDDKGINWNREVSAFETAVIVARHEEECLEAAEKIYQDLKEKEDVILYDGELSVGEAFAEADLIGVQRKVIIGNSFLDEGLVDIEDRNGEKEVRKVDKVR
jgi:prolyl-tRNA synthetase